MNKGTTLLQNMQVLKWCQEIGIRANWNLLYGFPGETAADYENVAHLCRLASHFAPPAGVNRIVYERFSPYFYDKEKYGLALRAASSYRFIYPGDRVALDKVAYCFDTDGQDLDESYIGPVREACDQWINNDQNRPAICTYKKGPGYVRIRDTRPLFEGKSYRKREIDLGDWTADAFLYCDGIRSFAAIKKKIAESGFSPTDQEMQAALDNLVKHGVMVSESGRYLSLPIRSN